jgi:D-arabinose 1-dehydrogenase-like Zn-dependent alcohol dehydrogenase
MTQSPSERSARLRVEFEGLEYHASDRVQSARYAMEGSSAEGWRITRNGSDHLLLGPGYRLLRTDRCGVCSTDLDRRFLPFPLPQIIGHELIALDADSRRHVIEINASHRARGLDTDCPFCAAGLATHCPDRRVLGIHDLPGGFGPWVLAP